MKARAGEVWGWAVSAGTGREVEVEARVRCKMQKAKGQNELVKCAAPMSNFFKSGQGHVVGSSANGRKSSLGDKVCGCETGLQVCRARMYREREKKES